MVGHAGVLAPTSPTPPPAEEGSHFQGSRPYSSADEHSEPMKCHSEPFAVILSEAKNLALRRVVH